MISKHVKRIGKDAMTLGVTGIGLGVASGLGGGAAVGKVASGLGTVGGLVMVGHGMNILKEAIPKKKKSGYY